MAAISPVVSRTGFIDGRRIVVIRIIFKMRNVLNEFRKALAYAFDIL